MQENRKENILLIDDEAPTLEFLGTTLNRKGYFVLTAKDGEEGVEKVKQFKARIVLCDIIMPKIDGIEFLKRVREYNLVTEVIMMTGKSSLDKCMEAIENGACGYLIKPLKIEEVLEAISRAKRNIAEKHEMIKKALEQKRKNGNRNPS